MNEKVFQKLHQAQEINTNLQIQHHALHEQFEKAACRHGFAEKAVAKLLSSIEALPKWQRRAERLQKMVRGLSTLMGPLPPTPAPVAEEEETPHAGALHFMDASIKRVQQLNSAMAEKTAILRSQTQFFEKMYSSPLYSAVERTTNDLLLGPLPEKIRFLRDAAHAAEYIRQALHTALPWPADGLLTWLYLLGGATSKNYHAVLTELVRPSAKLKIALSISGGLGDGVMLTGIANAIRHKYIDSDIYVITNISAGEEIFAGNRTIKGVLILDRDLWTWLLPALTSKLFEKNLLDIWYEYKYVTKVHYAPQARVSQSDREKTAAAFQKHLINFDRFPSDSNLLSEYCQAHHISVFDLVGQSAELDSRHMESVLFPSLQALKFTELIESLGSYVTIHHGCDPRMRRNDGKLQTKNWPKERWEAIISYIRTNYGIKVVQLGTADEERLSGALDFFMGVTDFEQSALLLKNARFHIDTEGGLVHVARAVKTPSLVLFGPTPLEFFGYPQNANIQKGNCHDCWWTTKDWFQSCPRGLVNPACMDAIVPSALHDALDAWLSTSAVPTYKLCDVTYFAKEQPESTKNWESRYVLNQLATHFGTRKLQILQTMAECADSADDLAVELFELGHDVHICAENFAKDSDPATENQYLLACADKLSFKFGSPFNLPYETASCDVVFCIAPPLQLEFAHLALREMLRVIKADGLVLMTFPIKSPRFSQPEENYPSAYTAAQLARMLFAFELTYAPQPAVIEQSCTAIKGSGVKIADGLTLGGLAIRKLAALPPSSQK